MKNPFKIQKQKKLREMSEQELKTDKKVNLFQAALILLVGAVPMFKTAIAPGGQWGVEFGFSFFAIGLALSVMFLLSATQAQFELRLREYNNLAKQQA